MMIGQIEPREGRNVAQVLLRRGLDPDVILKRKCSMCGNEWGLFRIDAYGAYNARWHQNICFLCEPDGL